MGVVLFSFLVTVTYSQEQPDNIFVEVACFKVKDGADLLPFMKEKGMAFNQKAQAKGALMDWVLLETLYPNGEECECDYRGVTVFTDMKQLDMMVAPDFGPTTAGEAFGDMAMANWQEFQKMAHFKGAQVYELKMSALPGPSGAMISSMRIMNIPGENIQAFMEMEKNVWMPLVKKAVEKGHLKDWSVWERKMPSGEKYDGNIVSVADFDSFSHMGAIDFAEIAKLFEEVHPGKNIMDAIKKSESLGDLVSEETVRFVTSLSNPQ